MAPSKDLIDWKQARLWLVLLIVVALVGVVLVVAKPYRFTTVSANTLLASNNAPIDAEIVQFGAAESYLVGVTLRQGEGVGNSYTANAASLFSIVLIGNHKPVTMLYFSDDPAGNRLDCRTNDGNVLKDRALSVAECTAFWDGFSGQKVRIDWPDATLSQSRVVFESHLVSVQAKDFESLGPSTFVVLTHAFPNAQQLLVAVNSIAGKVR